MATTGSGIDVELEHAIGFSGGIPNALHALSGESFVSVVGPNVVINSLIDPHAQRFLRGHTDNISTAQVSPSGRLIATGQRGDADIIVWETTSGRPLYKFEEHDGTIAALAFTTDERLLISAGLEDGLIIAWDLSSGAIVARKKQEPAPLLSLTCGGFVKDIKGRDTGLYQFAAAGSRAVTLWGLNPLDGRMECEKFALGGLQRDFLCATFAPLPGFPWLYVGSASGELAVIHTKSRAMQSSVFASGGGITSLAAVPADGGSVHLIVGSGDGTIQVFNHAATSLEHEIMLSAAAGTKGGVRSLVPVRSLSVAGSVWSLSPLPIRSTDGAVSFLAGTSQGNVYRVVPVELRPTARPGLAGAGSEPAGGLSATVVRQAHGAAVDPLPSAVAALIAVCGTTSAISSSGTSAPGKVTAAKAGSAASLLTGMPAPLVASARVPDILAASFAEGISDRFVTSGSDGYVRAWDAGDFHCISSTTARGAGYPTCVAFANDYFISGWQDGTIKAYLTDESAPVASASKRGSTEDSKFIWALPEAHAAREGGTTALIVSHNQRFFVSGGANGSIRVWDIRSRELVSQFKEHSAAITELVLLPNDTTLLSVSRDRSLITWDLKTERKISIHTLRLGGMNCVDGTPDGSLLITAGQDKNITYWDVRQTAPVKVIAYPAPPGKDDAEAVSICMAHRRSIFVTGGTDGVVRFWDVATGRQIMECVGHAGTVRDVQFSPDDKQVVSCGSDGAVLVWNIY